MGKQIKKWVIPLSISVVVIVLVVLPIWFAFWVTLVNIPRLSTAFGGIQAVGSMLIVAALVAAFAQVRETKKQLRDSRLWNKMSFALNYLPQFEMLRCWEEKLDESFLRIIRRDTPLTEPEIQALFTDENRQVFLMLKTFMNALEAYCVAINSGLADETMAKRIWGYKLVRHYVELRPYITYVRERSHNNSIFSELEAVYRKWSPEIPPEGQRYGDDHN
jgi:uncharacterized RDD family membrane protein YckC